MVSPSHRISPLKLFESSVFWSSSSYIDASIGIALFWIFGMSLPSFSHYFCWCGCFWYSICIISFRHVLHNIEYYHFCLLDIEIFIFVFLTLIIFLGLVFWWCPLCSVHCRQCHCYDPSLGIFVLVFWKLWSVSSLIYCKYLFYILY